MSIMEIKACESSTASSTESSFHSTDFINQKQNTKLNVIAADAQGPKQGNQRMRRRTVLLTSDITNHNLATT